MKVLDHDSGREPAKNDGVHLGKDKDSDLVSLMNSNNDEEEEDSDIVPTGGSMAGAALISSTTHSKETVNLNPTASKSSLVSGSVSRTSKSAANQQTEAASASGLMMPQHLQDNKNPSSGIAQQLQGASSSSSSAMNRGGCEQEVERRNFEKLLSHNEDSYNFSLLEDLENTNLPIKTMKKQAAQTGTTVTAANNNKRKRSRSNSIVGTALNSNKSLLEEQKACLKRLCEMSKPESELRWWLTRNTKKDLKRRVFVNSEYATELLDFVLENYEIDLNQPDHRGQGLFFYICHYGNLPMVKLCVEKFNARFMTCSSDTISNVAIEFGNL